MTVNGRSRYACDSLTDLGPASNRPGQVLPRLLKAPGEDLAKTWWPNVSNDSNVTGRRVARAKARVSRPPFP